MTNYTITIKPSNDRFYAPPAWLVQVFLVDPDANYAQLSNDTNGNMVYEVESTADMSTVQRVQGVVSVEQAAH